MVGWNKRRNWVNTSVKLIDSSFAVLLDDQYLRTPKKNLVLLPSRKLANEIAKEWQNQKDIIEPSQMPYSRLANSAIDKVKENFDLIVLDLLAYGDTDLVCYRADSPDDLVSLQKRSWDPILLWASTELQIELMTTQGVRYRAQGEAQRKKLFEEISSYDFFFLTAMYDLVTISGSLLIALAVARRHIAPKDGFNLSFLDEDWQRKQWGEDEESRMNKLNKCIEFERAFKFMTLL